MSQANIELIQRLYAAYERGDLDTVVAGCTPAVEWHSGGTKDDFPAFGPRKGRAGVQEFFRTVSETVDFDSFIPREFYADRDKVFVLGESTVTMKNGGPQARAEWVHIFTLRDNQVSKFREILDTASVVNAHRLSLVREATR